jgi:hypothetical protein
MPKYNIRVLRVSGAADVEVEAASQSAALAAALERPVVFGAPEHRCIAVFPAHVANGTSLESESTRSSS